ncbi:MUS38 [Fusarium circinatum]|uniref:MUS38 n=1 Tax=Fusarium circinatum TaxID=48490 RepID=A0A8H5SYR9_FUSCI|nr:MUS38 [Fusarium circinatum]
MSVVRHTSQERISTFFSRYCSLSKEECNKFAQSYLGCDIRQASIQGAFSYTVRGDDFVIQFRAERPPLDLAIIKHAHQMHGGWVPEKETVKDLAYFFSQAWNSPVPIDSSTVLIKRLDFRQKLQTLAESPPPRFQPLVSYCKDNLQFVFDSAIPWCLNHGDLCHTNIIIDPLTGKLSGVIDWAEGSILPFGCALWGLETVLGRFDFEKGEWVYDEQREDLEDLFWETFRSHVGSLNPAQERGITVARLTGLFFRHAFKFNGLYDVPKDDSWDLRLLDGQLFGDRQWLTACKIIEWDDAEASRVDCAFVAVPHDKHFETVGPLLAGGIHVLKEKPASLSVVELRQLQEVAATYNVRLSTALQGRYSDRYHTLKEWLPLIGTIQCVEATRENYKPQLDQGWRSRGILGGGVHVDLGWHLLDLVLDLLPGPQTPVVRFSECLLTRPYQQYDAEDTYFASLLLPSSTPPTPDIPCYLKASRMSYHKTEKICIIGTDGTLVGEDCVVDLFASFESGRKRFTKTCAPPSVSINQMLLNFAQEVREERPSSEYQRHSDLDLRVTHTSEKIRSSWEPKFKPQTAQDIGDPISAID